MPPTNNVSVNHKKRKHSLWNSNSVVWYGIVSKDIQEQDSGTDNSNESKTNHMNQNGNKNLKITLPHNLNECVVYHWELFFPAA